MLNNGNSKLRLFLKRILTFLISKVWWSNVTGEPKLSVLSWAHLRGWSGCACKDCDHPPSLGGEKPLREEDREENEPKRQSWHSHPVKEKDLWQLYTFSSLKFQLSQRKWQMSYKRCPWRNLLSLVEPKIGKEEFWYWVKEPLGPGLWVMMAGPSLAQRAALAMHSTSFDSHQTNHYSSPRLRLQAPVHSLPAPQSSSSLPLMPSLDPEGQSSDIQRLEEKGSEWERQLDGFCTGWVSNRDGGLLSQEPEELEQERRQQSERTPRSACPPFNLRRLKEMENRRPGHQLSGLSPSCLSTKPTSLPTTRPWLLGPGLGDFQYL